MKSTLFICLTIMTGVVNAGTVQEYITAATSEYEKIGINTSDYTVSCFNNGHCSINKPQAPSYFCRNVVRSPSGEVVKGLIVCSKVN